MAENSVEKGNGDYCVYCKSTRVNKAGKARGDDNRQRYYCRDCKTFSTEGAEPRTKKTVYTTPPSLIAPSKRTLKLELHRIEKLLGRPPRTKDINKLSGERKCHPLDRYYEVFGSFVKAMRYAGLNPGYRQKPDKLRLLKQLMELSEELDRPLFERHIKQARREGKISPPYHFQLAFGSVSKAIKASGVNTRFVYDGKNYFERNDGKFSPRNKFTKTELIEYLRKLRKELGRVPRGGDIKEKYELGRTPGYKAYIKEFGTITNARKSAGIPNPQWQKFTRKQLIGQLESLGKTLGKRPTDRDIVKACAKGEAASCQVFVKEFGSLEKAYQAAGFEVTKPHKYSDKELLIRVQKLRRELGRPIGWNDLERASKEGWCPSAGTVFRRLRTNSEGLEEILNPSLTPM